MPADQPMENGWAFIFHRVGTFLWHLGCQAFLRQHGENTLSSQTGDVLGLQQTPVLLPFGDFSSPLRNPDCTTKEQMLVLLQFILIPTPHLFLPRLHFFF